MLNLILNVIIWLAVAQPTQGMQIQTVSKRESQLSASRGSKQWSSVSFPARGRDTSGIFSLKQKDMGSSIQESSRKLALDVRHCINLNRWSPVRKSQHLFRACLAGTGTQQKWHHSKWGHICLEGDKQHLKGSHHILSNPCHWQLCCPSAPGAHCKHFCALAHPQWGTRSSAGHWPALGSSAEMVWGAGAPFGKEMLLMALPCCFIPVTCEHETKDKPLSLAAPHRWDWPWSASCLWQAQKKTHRKLNVLSVKTHETCGAEHRATTDTKTVLYWNMKI